MSTKARAVVGRLVRYVDLVVAIREALGERGLRVERVLVDSVEGEYRYAEGCPEPPDRDDHGVDDYSSWD